MGEKSFIKAICVLTKNGKSVMTLSKKKPTKPIIGMSASQHIVNYLAMVSSVIPKLVPDSLIQNTNVCFILFYSFLKK